MWSSRPVLLNRVGQCPPSNLIRVGTPFNADGRCSVDVPIVGAIRIGSSRICDMPGVVHALARRVTGIFVFDRGIKRLAFIGPLFAAIVARDERKTSRLIGIGVGNQRKPIGGALGVAIRFAGVVAVEDVECHSVDVDEGFALGCVGADRRRCLRQRRERTQTNKSAGTDSDEAGNNSGLHAFLHRAYR